MNKNNQEGLRCPLEKNDNIFFSLVDYRNNLFTSNDPNKIMEFYESFTNRDQLIQWMRERPKGMAYVHEMEGDKDIIVVIPTADYEGDYAKECRENVFKGLHLIFVESGGRGDFYFNFAHYVNVGIKKAMEYSPKWIVYSGDDMYKIDDASILVNELSKIPSENVDVVFTERSYYHSLPAIVGKPNFIYKLITIVNQNSRLKYQLTRRYGVQYYLNVENLKTSIAFKKVQRFLNTVSFGIFSMNFLETTLNQWFDETFINHAEESDRSLQIMLKKKRCVTIKYKIGDFVGVSLGNGLQRLLRNVASEIYFDSKFKGYIAELKER